MIIKLITTEKAVKIMEIDNTLIFQVDTRASKDEIKEEVEKMFSVKVAKVRTLKRSNKKMAHVRLNKKNLAIDVATKLGAL
jgi:Ribosomal protein L23